jgi:soluble lytic murein transglycosylase-like protein
MNKSNNNTTIILLIIIALICAYFYFNQGHIKLPTIKVSSSSPDVTGYIAQKFGAYSGVALAVAKCESGYNPNAVNPQPVQGSNAVGVFQILVPATWNTTSYVDSDPQNYESNINAAYEIFSRDGFSWREWACKP